MKTDWEKRLRSWGKPPSKHARTKADNAKRMIKKAIAADPKLSRLRIKVKPKGSYRNRTNVGLSSDVDISVLCKDYLITDLPTGYCKDDFDLSINRSYPFRSFRQDVAQALINFFGEDGVSIGNKAFDIHSNTYRTEADVVPCFEYRQYYECGGYEYGTAFMTSNNRKVINWPKDNYSNGVKKNNETSRRYKAMVRSIKSLRDYMIKHDIESATNTPSFLIESLLYNVPNKHFRHDSYYKSADKILSYLARNLCYAEDYGNWTEVNDLKLLFRRSQAWNRTSARRFVMDSLKILEL